MSATRHLAAFAVAFALVSASGSTALAQKNYDTGATDTEIKIGNIMPYSGAASAYGVIGKTEDAYFRKINAEGGINGRKITFISYDDAYTPPKTVEQARKLVESDEIDVLFAPLGAPTNAAIMKYMNQKKVPHLFIASGATKFGDYKNFPYTMGFQPCYQIEGRAFAQHVLSTQTDPKIGIVYQNDDFGRGSGRVIWSQGAHPGKGAGRLARPRYAAFRGSS